MNFARGILAGIALVSPYLVAFNDRTGIDNNS